MRLISPTPEERFRTTSRKGACSERTPKAAIHLRIHDPTNAHVNPRQCITPCGTRKTRLEATRPKREPRTPRESVAWLDQSFTDSTSSRMRCTYTTLQQLLVSSLNYATSPHVWPALVPARHLCMNRPRGARRVRFIDAHDACLCADRGVGSLEHTWH